MGRPRRKRTPKGPTERQAAPPGFSGRRRGRRGLLRLGLRLRRVFLVGAMASDCAARGRAENAMAAGHMAGHAADSGALQAAFGRRRAGQGGERCEQAEGKNLEFHGLAPEVNWKVQRRGRIQPVRLQAIISGRVSCRSAMPNIAGSLRGTSTRTGSP
jgi:hypothetical protein